MDQINFQLSGTVTSTPDVLGGTPVIKKTRIPASLVFELFKRGYSVDLIISEYPSLTKKKVNGFLSSISKSFNVPKAQAV